MKAAQVLLGPACLSGSSRNCDHLQGRLHLLFSMHREPAQSGPPEPQEIRPSTTIARSLPRHQNVCLWSHFGPNPSSGPLEPTTAFTVWIIRSFIHRFPAVRSELWLHSQLCPSRGSQVGLNAGKGAHELSFKGGIETTAVDTTCCKLKEGPRMSQKRPLVCKCGGGPRWWKRREKRGTQGQRLLASAVAAAVGILWTVDSQCGHMSMTLISSQSKRKGAGCGSTRRVWSGGWREMPFLSSVPLQCKWVSELPDGSYQVRSPQHPVWAGCLSPCHTNKPHHVASLSSNSRIWGELSAYTLPCYSWVTPFLEPQFCPL